MSTRIRLSLPALLAVLLAAALGQAPAAAASTARMLVSTRSALATVRAPAHAPRGAAGFPAVRGQPRTSLLPMPAHAAGLRDRVAAGNHDSALAGDPGASRWSHHRFGSFGSALVGSAPAGKGPSALAVDAATHTIYVANGNNTDGPSAGGNTVSVIDARHCNARDVSRCQGPWPTITVGHLPAGIAVDQKTDTVYVTDGGDNTVSVFDGATCNATDTSGCGQKPATVPVGPGPLALFDDPANHTVYIADCGSSCGIGGPASTIVSMLDTATCNATDLRGCPATPPPTADVGAAPVNVDVNQVTHTAYVTTIGARKTQNGWAVFDASTCNATVRSGCGTTGRLLGDPNGPNDAQVDPANNTLYTANFDNTISAFSLRHCNARDLAGCATDKPGIVTPFPWPRFEHDLWVTVDTPLHSVYVSYQKDDALIVVNTRVCNGSHPAGCATLRPPTVHTGADPEGSALDGRTQTLYTADEVDNSISVIDPARCNAHDTSGCRHPVPAVAIPEPGPLAADPAVHTAYVTSGAHNVSMIDTRACSTRHLAGCAHTPAQATVGTTPSAIAVDHRTHTVYVADFGPFSGRTGTVSVLDARTCNATWTTGCTRLSTLAVPGGHPDGLAVNAATGTLYVATITAHGPNLISVFNAATCNAIATTGCGQAPATLKVGRSARENSALSLAVNQATNTIYATNVITNTVPFGGHSVYVFNGATCDAVHTTGCGQAPATVNAGFNPWGIAVDQATDTIYTANIADGEHPGTASVINGATCNGTNHTGCSQAPATVSVGFGAVGIAVDPAADMIYVTNTEDTSVSVINGNTCNGTSHTGCGRAPAKAAVGNYPGAIATDPAAGTAYVANFDNTVSVIPLTHQIR